MTEQTTNSLAAAALALCVDPQDLAAVLPVLREAKERRTSAPTFTVTVYARCFDTLKPLDELTRLGYVNPPKTAS